jgi:hypothetical protein
LRFARVQCAGLSYGLLDSGGMRDSSFDELEVSYLRLRGLLDGEASLSVHVSGDVRREIRQGLL